MLRAFRSNGLKFYPVNSLLQPTGTRFLDLPYTRQRIAHQAQNYCTGHKVWFNDLIKIQVASDDTTVSFTVRNAAGTTLQVGNFTDRGAFNGAKVFWATINLAAVPGLNDGSTILITTSAGERLLSEPLFNDTTKTIKIVYSNFLDNYDYGSYRNCEEMIHYCRAELVEHILPSEQVSYQDARGRFRKLIHSWHDGRLLQTQSLTWYEISILHAALNHDIIKITENTGTNLVTSGYEPLQDELTQISRPTNPYQGYTASLPLVEVGTYGRRITVSENPVLTLLITLLPETNISATSFTANWQALTGVDFYEAQISTDPNFNTIVQSATGLLNTFYTFSGLTSCVKYYYRVRASICSVLSPWATNVTQQRQTIHLRGDFKKAVITFDEKIIALQVNNLLGLAQNIQYKITAGTVANANDPVWSLQPYLTLTQLQSNIDAQAGAYTVYFEIADYTQGSDAVLELVYNTAFFWLRVGCTTYNFNNGISQDTLIGGSRRINIDSITLTNSATIVGYELMQSAATAAPVTFTTSLSALNAAILALLPSQQYLVGIYVSNSNTIATINVSYL